MRLILISGDGHGAGKTFLARKLTRDECIYSVANLIRLELKKKYPTYDWYNKDPIYKTNTKVLETKKTVHEMLDELGRAEKAKKKLVWAIKLKELIEYGRDRLKLEVAVVDDVRFVDECLYLKGISGLDFVTHIHIVNSRAKPEPQYDNDKLKAAADYCIERS